MQLETYFLLPSVIDLNITAVPVIFSFTEFAIVESAHIDEQADEFKNLNLSDDQKSQIKSIYQSTRQQMDAVLTAEQKAQLEPIVEPEQKFDLNLSDDQKSQVKSIHESIHEKIAVVLTAEQKTQLQIARKQHRKANLTLTSAQKSELKTIYENEKSQLNAILTPEQKQEHEQQPKTHSQPSN